MTNNCECNKCKKDPCGCAEPVFSIEAMPDDPTVLRFNVNGKSIWYDFTPVVKEAETCTTLTVDTPNRTLNYLGECGENTISARELGAILHLADIGDVDANSIEDNGILNYRKDSDCGEGCEGVSNGWVSTSPIDVGKDSLDYILGSDADGKMNSLMPPTDTNKFNYLAWRGADKAGWTTLTEFATPPTDADGYKYAVYVDPATGQLGYVKEQA